MGDQTTVRIRFEAQEWCTVYCKRDSVFLEMDVKMCARVVDDMMGWDKEEAVFAIQGLDRDLMSGLDVPPMNECVWNRGGLRDYTGGDYECRIDFLRRNMKEVVFVFDQSFETITLGDIKDRFAETSEETLRFLYLPGATKYFMLGHRTDAVAYADDTLLQNVGHVQHDDSFVLVSVPESHSE